MSFLALSFTLIFIVITMLISLKNKLGLEKDILIGTIRASIQLLVIGYVLSYVFAAHQWWMMVSIIMVMILVAARNAAKRGKQFQYVATKIFVTILAVECIVMLLLLGLDIITATARYIIPLSGMTIGNAMVVTSLFLTQYKRELESSNAELEMLLAYGADRKQALHHLLKRSVKFSMIPTIDALKTVGLVQLPGMMTGMIIAGASPTEAVKYQLLILFVHAGAAACTAIMLSGLFGKEALTNELTIKRYSS